MKRTIFCLCPAAWKDAILPKLAEEAGPVWSESGLISIRWLSESELANHSNNLRRVNEKLSDGNACEILLLGDVCYEGPTFPSPISTIRRIDNPKEFRSQITEILAANGLDLVSMQTNYIVPRWETFNVSRDHVMQWLSQFKSLGDYEWVGKGILASIQCLSTAELVSRLDLATPSQNEQIVYYVEETEQSGNDGPGEELGSSVPLAHAVFKGRRPVNRFDIGRVRDTGGPYALIEDCAISGREFEKFLEATFLSASAVEDDRLAQMTLHYAVIGNGAEIRIKGLIEEHGLLNFNLQVNAGQRLVTLTAEGLAALEEGKFYCPIGKYCLNPSKFVQFDLFSRSNLWGSHERAGAAKRLLRRIGEQLYRADLVKRKGDTTSRSDEWLRQAGLGAGGLGLNIALARSVPKSTLPVVWCSGEIMWGKKPLHWIPLLPHGNANGQA